jgi:hypothetical protein
MPALNLGLEIVAIHPDSEGIWAIPEKQPNGVRETVVTGLDPVIHLL